MKFYDENHISVQFENLSNKKKVEILLSALSEMQMYNGRSVIRCIGIAMGYSNTEGSSNTYFKD